MTTKTYPDENKPKFDPNKPFTPVGEKPVFNPDKPFTPIKKKDSGISSEPVSMDGQTGLSVSDKEKLTAYLTADRTDAKRKQAVAETIAKSKPLTQLAATKKSYELIKPLTEKIDATAKKKLDEVMYGEGWQDPLKEIRNKLKTTKDPDEFSALSHAFDIAKENLAPDGFEAKIILSETSLGEGDDKNETSGALRNVAAKYDNAVEPLRQIRVEGDLSQQDDETLHYRYLTDIKNAAVKKMVNEHPDFARQVQDMGLDINDPLLSNKIPNVKMGSILNEYLHDPNVETFISKENPGLKPAIDYAKKSILTDNPDYGVNVVANEVSRAMQKEGYNNIDPVFNFDTQTSRQFANDVAYRMYKDDPGKLKIYNDFIADSQQKYLDKPSFFTSFAQAGKDVVSGIGSTASSLVSSKADDIKEKWIEEASHVSADPKGVVKVMRDIGHATGFVATLAAGGELAAGTKLITNPATAQKVLIGTSFFGNELKEAEMKYKNPVKSWLSAAVNTGAFMYLNNIFPASKVSAAINEAKPAFAKAVENLASGKITKEAFRQETNNIFKQTIDFGKKAFKQNVTTSAEMAALSGMNQAVDQIFNLDDQTYAKYHPKGEVMDAFTSMFLSNSLVSGISAYGSVKNGNREMENSLFEAASNPKRMERVIEEMGVKDHSVNVNELTSNLKYLEGVKADLDARGISEPNQKRYLFESIRNKVMKENMDKTPDANMTRQAKEESRHGEEIMNGILEGKEVEDIVTTEKEKEQKETLSAEADRNKLIEKGNKAIDKLLEEKDEDDKPVFKGIYRDIAKSDPVGFFEEIAQQAWGIDKDGNPLKGGGREIDMIPKYGADIINVAKELFPKPTKSKISVIQPGEIKKPEVTTIAPKEIKNEATEQLQQPVAEGLAENTEANEPIAPKEESQPSEKLTIQSGSTGEGQPPISEPPKSGRIHVERPATELSHKGLQDVANEFSLPDVETRDRKSDIQLRKDAENKINEWVEKGEYGNKVEGLVKKAETGDILTDEQRVILEQHLANVSNELRSLPKKSPEFDAKLAEIKRLKDAGEKTRSEAGAALRIPTFRSRPKDLSDYYVAEMEAAGVGKLTEQQRETVEKEFDAITEAEKKWDDKIKALQEENARLKAEAEVKKAPKTKGAKKDFKAERTQIFDDIKAKLKKARGETSATIVPYAKELFAIAPDVAKLMRSYVEQGITELSDIVKNIHSDLKDAIPDIKETDVRDIIAGNYSEKRTQSQLAAQLRDLRSEANYINQLEALERGEEPVSNRKKIERNRKIAELQKKIKEHDVTKLAGYKKRVTSQIEEIEKQIQEGDFSKDEKPKPIVLDKEAKELQDKLISLKHTRELRMLKQEYEKSAWYEKIQKQAARVLNLPRSLMSTLDFSAVLRQSFLATVGHPILASKAAVQMFKSAFSSKEYDRWFEELKHTPRYQLMNDSKLALTDNTSPELSQREEAYMSDLAEKVPLIKELVKGSSRAYSMYLNKMRADVFNQLAAQMEKNGKTWQNSEEQYKQLAAFVNNITGRGDLGKTLNDSAPILNSLFFSPRLITSRVNTLTYLAQPRFYTKVPREVRRAYFKDLISTAGVGLLILGLAKAAGADTEDDPRSPDFGKIRSGKTRWDIWGGHQQYIRAAAQMISGSKKTSSGNIKELGGGKPGDESVGDVGTRFFRGKLAPVPSLLTDILQGRNMVGDKLTTDWQSGNKEIGLKENLMTHLLPLTITGMKDAMQDQGAKALLTVGVPSLLGVGTQTYDNTGSGSKTPQSRPEKKERPHR